MSEKTTRPFCNALVHCTFTVSAVFRRSLVSSRRQASSATAEGESPVAMRIVSPARRIIVAYQPAGIVSRATTRRSGAGRGLGPGSAFGAWPLDFSAS